MSVRDGAARLKVKAALKPLLEEPMQYALLAYGRPDKTGDAPGPIEDAIAELLTRPDVTGWIRLHIDESATTLRTNDGRTLLTDGPFIDSKEYLAGVIVVEAENLDAALALAQQFQDARPAGGALEVRPMIDGLLRAA
jgi:hypothetical protein